MVLSRTKTGNSGKDKNAGLAENLVKKTLKK